MATASEPEEMLEMTAEMLGESLRIPKDDAYLLIQFGERRGWVKRIGTMPQKPGPLGTTTRGRGASIYRIPLHLGELLNAMWGKRQGVM